MCVVFTMQKRCMNQIAPTVYLMAALYQWNKIKQRGWSSRSGPGTLLSCFSYLARGSWALTRLWTLLFQLPSRLVDVWAGGHTLLSFTPACTAAATEGSAGTLLNISAHKSFYESQLGLASSSPFSVFCPLLCCQNSSKYEHICEKGIADTRCYPHNYFLHENYVALTELSLWKYYYLSVLSTILVVKWWKSTVNL